MDTTQLNSYIKSIWEKKVEDVLDACNKVMDIFESKIFYDVQQGLSKDPHSEEWRATAVKVLADLRHYSKAGREFNNERELPSFEDALRLAVGNETATYTLKAVDVVYEMFIRCGDIFEEKMMPEAEAAEAERVGDYFDYSVKVTASPAP